jgi:hypothetical protein
LPGGVGPADAFLRVLMAETGLVAGRRRMREIDDEGRGLRAWLAKRPDGELSWMVRRVPTGR